jgi:hypothetical protein
MNNETDNQNVGNYSSLQPIATKDDPIRKMAKISLIVFIVSLVLLAIFDIFDIWGIFGNDSGDIFGKIESSFGILTGASFLLNLGLRIFTVKKK